MDPLNALFSPATRAGDWLAVSGQLGVDPEEGRLAADVHGQTKQAIANVLSVLRPHGADLASVVKVNVFLSDMAHYDEMNTAYVESFAGLRKPSRTTVAVAGLPRGAALEIEAWAHLSAD